MLTASCGCTCCTKRGGPAIGDGCVSSPHPSVVVPGGRAGRTYLIWSRMLTRLRSNASVVVVLLAMVVVEAIALRSHTLGIVLIGAVAGIALIIVLFRASITKIAVAAAYACAFTLTWNGWFLGPV